MSPEKPNHSNSNHLSRVTPALRQLVEEKGLLREFGPGEQIIQPSTWGDQIRLVVSGQASLVLLDDHGEKIAVDVLGPGDIFGEVNFFTGSPWPSDSLLIADGPCVVVEIPPEDFERLLGEDGHFGISLVRNLTRKTIKLHRSIFEGKVKRRALQAMISREDHVFPGHLVGDYMQKRFAKQIEELAQTEGPVLLVGETGVGKEGIAHALYRAGHHFKEVFLLVDLLGSSPSDTVDTIEAIGSESENELTETQMKLFFGSEEPAKDGGTKEIPGYFQLADEGTLLIRGVDKLTPVMQVKILEALVTQTFRRCGGVRLHKSKVRVLATTRLDPSAVTLEENPLLYALMQERCIIIPPLRKRRREIPVLVNRYLDRYTKETGRKIEKLPRDTLKALLSYHWPGNDMELSNTLKRAVLVSVDGVILPQDIYFDLRRIEERGKVNLLKFDRVKRALTSPHFPAVFQSAATPFFFIILAFLFFGPTDPAKNPAALFSWALGWPVLIISAFFFARFWCSVCPIGTIGKLAKRLISLDKPFPAFLKTRSDFVLAGAVLVIIWLETATGIRNSPFNLGLLLVAMLVSAIIVAMVYERQTWCLYLCGLGGMVGLFAKTSIIELRADRNVCISQCGTNDCYLGSSDSEGCPFGQAGPRLHSNRLCKLCATCVKNCPYGAINLNLRFPGREIWEVRQPRTGTAFLVLGMIGGLISEMSTKTAWYTFILDHGPQFEAITFTIVYISIVLMTNLVVIMASFVSSRVLREGLAENYSRYGLALLPLALTTFGAFHVYYLVHLGVHVAALLSQNFNLDIFQRLSVTMPDELTAFVQKCLMWLGLVGSLVVFYRIGRENYKMNLNTVAGLMPHALLALGITVFAIHSMMAFFYG
jgi:transcriptional regulator with AAA-type ATPase domain/ferredoxin